MSRVDTLSEGEAKVVDTLREIAKGQETIHTAQAVKDLRAELNDIHHVLITARPEDYKEILEEVSDRIYRLLY